MAFAGKGGSELARITTVELALTVGGALACAAGVLLAVGRRPRGILAVGLFGLLAALTALSIDWSVAPDASWIEANRTLSYLAVFAGAVALGNLVPTAGPIVLRALLLAASIVVGYALVSRVWPAELAELEIYARIGQPFGYWNAVGVTAALALPAALWLGTRRVGPSATQALAFPATGLLIVALFLTYSRSALLAAVVAAVLWIVFVPLRLRSAALLLSASVVATPVLLWTSGEAAFTEDGVELAVREDAGQTFGILLLVLVVVLYALGYAFARGRERTTVGPAGRARIGRLLIAGLAVLALAGAVGVMAGDRGLTGTVSDRWSQLWDDSATTGGGPTRLGSAASSRGRYWRQALDVFEDEPLVGAGAGGFTTASLRYRDRPLASRHAHGYPVQTLADLGLLGFLIAVALALAWLAAGLRAVGAIPRPRDPAWTEDRLAVTALFLSVVAFGVQSTIDWTWFVPGPTVMALVAAGVVAGGRPSRGAAEAYEPRTRARPGAARLAVTALALLAAGAACWSIWQPERADRRADEAVVLSGNGELDRALEAARNAQDIDPLAVKPLFAEAAVHQRAGRDAEALEVFRKAVADHPKDPQVWLRLADFQLYELDDPETALAALDQALYLDPLSESIRDSFIEARGRLRQRGILPPEPPAPPGQLP